MSIHRSLRRPRFARRVARVSAVSTGAVAVLAAAPAFADVPTGWDDPYDVSALQWLMLIGAALALVLVISLLTLLPGFIRGEGFVGRDEHADDQWLGGPHGSAGELGAGDQHDADSARTTGGASATW